MIRNIRHKGLRRLFEEDSARDINPGHAQRLRDILARLDVASSSQDMNLPGLHLHLLKGSRRDTWAVTVSGNWRVTFKFAETDVTDVNYEDYH